MHTIRVLSGAILVYRFLCPSCLVCACRESVRWSRSNQVWGPIVSTRFGIVSSDNFFEEFKWQLKRTRHQTKYKRMWTCGCMGKIRALGEKPTWSPAETTWCDET